MAPQGHGSANPAPQKQISTNNDKFGGDNSISDRRVIVAFSGVGRPPCVPRECHSVPQCLGEV